MGWLAPFADFFSGLTYVEGLLLILVLVLCRWVSRSHRRQLDDRQREIDRLAADNREYRERFLQFVDRTLRLPTATNQPKTEE